MFLLIRVFQTVFILGLSISAYLAYIQFTVREDNDVAVRSRMARQVAHFAACVIPIPEGRPLIAVAEADGDFRSVFSSELRHAVARQNASVVDLHTWHSLIPSQYRSAMAVTPERASAIADDRKIPYLLCSKIINWTVEPTSGIDLEVEVLLISVPQSTILYRKVLSLTDCESSPSDRVVAEVSRREPVMPLTALSLARDPRLLFVGWLSLGLALPWLAAKAIVLALKSSANTISIAIVLSYLGVLTGSAWLTWGQFGIHWINAGIILVLSIAWLKYLEYVCYSLEQSYSANS